MIYDLCDGLFAAYCFWENHDPRVYSRRRGTQYRSGIYYFTEAQAAAEQLVVSERLLAAAARSPNSASAHFLLCRGVSPAVSA